MHVLNCLSLHIQDDLLTVGKVYHFKLPGFCHLVTVFYPSGTRDGETIDDNKLGECFTYMY